mgnify:CR=1 FL=1
MTADTRWRPLAIIMILILLLAIFLLEGCASLDYDWQRTKAPSPQPWVYVYPADVHAACIKAGASTAGLDRILGCATSSPTGCTIYLPRRAPAGIIAHEEKHCAGFTH